MKSLGRILTGAAGVALVATGASMASPTADSCHLAFFVIDGASSYGCRGTCTVPTCDYKVLSGGRLDCACNSGNGPVPQCCHTGVQAGLPTIPIGLGDCSAQNASCPDGESCDPVWHPIGTTGDGQWIAECEPE